LLEGLLPNRFGILVAGLAGLLVAIAADLALDRLPARAHRPALAAAVLVLLAPLTPHVLQATHRPAAPHLITSGLSRHYLSSGIRVLALPFPTATDTRAMDWQADDGLRWSMPGGFFIGPACQGHSCRARGIMGASQPPTAALLTNIGDGQVEPQTLTPQQIGRAKKDISEWGVREVLVGPGQDADRLVAAMTLILGRPGQHVADCWLWQVDRTAQD
jgi:hypothetical protein